MPAACGLVWASGLEAAQLQLMVLRVEGFGATLFTKTTQNASPFAFTGRKPSVGLLHGMVCPL